MSGNDVHHRIATVAANAGKEAGGSPGDPLWDIEDDLADMLFFGKRRLRVCNVLERETPRHERGDVAGMTVIGDVTGRKCIIVDDICDTASTLCKAAETLMEAGATEVHAYTTHGVLSGPAVERISKSVLGSRVVTDTIEAHQPVLDCDRIRIVPTAPMLAQAIVNIWNGTSVSSLFDTNSLVPIYEGLYPKGMYER